MGSLNAQGFAEAVADGSVGLRQAVAWHLGSNHYPPPPVDLWLPVCLQAIQLAADEDWDTLVDLPEGITHPRHGAQAPASVIVESWHLDPFVESLANDFDEDDD